MLCMKAADFVMFNCLFLTITENTSTLENYGEHESMSLFPFFSKLTFEVGKTWLLAILLVIKCVLRGRWKNHSQFWYHSDNILMCLLFVLHWRFWMIHLLHYQIRIFLQSFVHSLMLASRKIRLQGRLLRRWAWDNSIFKFSITWGLCFI